MHIDNKFCNVTVTKESSGQLVWKVVYVQYIYNSFVILDQY